MTDSCPLRIDVTFFWQENGGPVHAAAKAAFAPWSAVRTLCGEPLTGLRKAAEWAVGHEKAIGIPANPFYSDRGCVGCQERLAV